MAVDIYLNSDGDIDLQNSTMRLTENIEESSRQQVLITLRTFKGEWPFNINYGIPYLQNETNSTQLLGAANQQLIDANIREGILSAENVTDIRSYSSTFNREEARFSTTFTAITNTGQVISLEDVTPLL